MKKIILSAEVRIRKSGRIISYAALFLAIWIMLPACSKNDDFENSSYAKIYVFWDKHFFQSIGYEVFTLSNYASLSADTGISYRIKQTHPDRERKLMAPSPVHIVGEQTMINQCGSYDSEINVNGEVTRLTGFRYSGEQTLPIARGFGWSMYISRDNWK